MKNKKVNLSDFTPPNTGLNTYQKKIPEKEVS